MVFADIGKKITEKGGLVKIFGIKIFILFAFALCIIFGYHFLLDSRFDLDIESYGPSYSFVLSNSENEKNTIPDLAVWFKVKGELDEGYHVIFNDTKIPSTVDIAQNLVTALVPDHSRLKPGRYPMYIENSFKNSRSSEVSLVLLEKKIVIEKFGPKVIKLSELNMNENVVIWFEYKGVVAGNTALKFKDQTFPAAMLQENDEGGGASAQIPYTVFKKGIFKMRLRDEVNNFESNEVVLKVVQ